MSGPNVGYATLSVIPSMKGVKNNLSREFGGPLAAAADEAGRASSASFLRRFSSSTLSGLDSLGGQIVDTVKKGALVGVASAGAVVAGGLWGGMKRALDREDAIVTFRRMGLDDRNINELTDAIDKALSGTPISNPEGFSLAGRFLAQGFEQADIPGIISTIADMSSVGNRSFQEMADVMVAAAGAGKLTAAELNRLGDVPLGRVAEQLGLTESGLRELVKEGGLTAEAFMTAFGAVEEFNGAAKDATTRVAFANLKTAISALGERFLAPLLGENGVAQRGLLRLRELVSGLGPAVSRMGEAFFGGVMSLADRLGWVFTELRGSAWAFLDAWKHADGDVTSAGLPGVFERLGYWARVAFDFIRDNRSTISDLLKSVGPAAAAVASLAVSVNLVGRAFRILKMATPIGLLLAAATAFVHLYRTNDRFRKAVQDVAAEVRKRWPAISKAIQTAISAVVDFVRQHWPTVQSTIASLITWFETSAMPVIRTVFQFLADQVGHVVAWVRENWPDIQRTIASTMEAIGIVIQKWVAIAQGIWDRWGTQITAVVKSAWETATRLIRAALDIIRGVIDTVTSLIRGDWSGVWEGIKTILSGVWEAIKAIISHALTLAREWISIAWDAVKEATSIAWEAIKSAVSGAVDKLLEWLGNVWDMAVEFASWLATPFVAAWDAVSGAVSKVIDWLKGLWDRALVVADFFRNVLEGAIDLAKDAWERLQEPLQWVVDKLDAIYEKAKRAAEWIGKAIDRIKSPAGNILDKMGVLPEADGYHSGGWVGSPFGPARDVPAVLQTGEYVLSRRDVQSIMSAPTSMWGTASSSSPADAAAGGYPTTLTVVIEGTPLTGVVVANDAEMRALLQAGVS